MTRVKICGLTRIVDVVASLDAGADAVGFVRERSSPRFLEKPQVQELIGFVGPYCTTVSVFGHHDGSRSDTNAVQAVSYPGQVPNHSILAIRLRCDTDPSSILAEVSSQHEALLLDAYSASEFGGTGQIVDWELAAEVVRRSSLPIILAGGLTPDNVAEAVERVQPYAVDVSSGVEISPGVKDPSKISAFVRAAKSVRVTSPQ